MIALRRVLVRALHAEELPASFWVLWSGAFLNRLGNFVVPFLAIYLTEQRGQSAARAGVMMSLYGLGSVAASLTGGALADRAGRRATMLGALLSSAVAMLQLSTAHEPVHLAASVLALGFFGELYRPAMQAMVADLVPAGAPREAAFGALYWAANLGFACSTLVAGLLAAQSFRLLFVGDALTTVLFAAVTAVGLRETLPRGERREASSRAVLAPFLDRSFVALMASNLLIVLCFFQVNSTLPVAARQAGLSMREFGLLMALNGVMIVTLQPLSSRLLAGSSRRHTLALGALLIGVGFAAHAAATTLAGWAVGVVLWTLGEIVVAPRMMAVVSDLAPAHLRGSYQGAFSFSHAFGAFMGPLTGGWLLAHHGPSLVWLLCGLAGAVAGAGMLRLRR